MVRKILVVAVVMSLGVACSSKSNTTTPTPTPTVTATGGGATVSATEKDFAITLASGTATAGSITFSVKNDGPSTHEFVIFRTDLAEDKLPMESDGTEIDEEGAGITHVDEIEDIAAGKTETLTETLTAGNYVLVCNISGHYKLGMHAKLTVA